MTHASAVSRPRVSWFELFYDLVLVAAVLQGSHLFEEEPSLSTGAWLAVTLLILLALWLATTLTFNTTRGAWALRRVLTLVQMVALVIASLSISRVSGLSDAVGFIALGTAFACVAALYAVMAQDEPQGSRWSRPIALSTGVAAAVCLIGAMSADGDAPAWRNPASYALGLALALVVVPLLTVYVGRLASGGQLDRDHLAERMGQIVLIAFGESLADLVLSLGDRDSIPNPLVLVLTFLVLYAMWDVYFRTVTPWGAPNRASALRGWIAAHALLVFGAIGTAAGCAALVVTPLDSASTTLASYRLTLPLLYVMVAFLAFAWLSGAQGRCTLPVHGGAVALLLIVNVLGVVGLEHQAVAMGIVGSTVVIADAALVAFILRDARGSRGWLRPVKPGPHG